MTKSPYKEYNSLTHFGQIVKSVYCLCCFECHVDQLQVFIDLALDFIDATDLLIVINCPTNLEDKICLALIQCPLCPLRMFLEYRTSNVIQQHSIIERHWGSLRLASSRQESINTLRPRHNGRHFADYIFKCIFLNENAWLPIEISLKFVPKGPINYIPALVQIMAWRRPGDKPLSETMMVKLLTHICVTLETCICIGVSFISLLKSADLICQYHLNTFIQGSWAIFVKGYS